MYVLYMYCKMARTHEDMLFQRGECVTHWEFRFSGELVTFKELGQPDLIKVL